MNSRRKFLVNSSALMAGGLLTASLDNRAFAIFKNKISPNDQINIGSIGIKGMGWADTNAALKIPGVNLAAICDVDQSVIDTRKADIAKLNIDVSKVKVYTDYRKLLEQKDIDVIIIGTPDHWPACTTLL